MNARRWALAALGALLLWPAAATARPPTVRSVLAADARSGAISQSDLQRYTNSLRLAERAAGGLSGTRQAELQSVLTTLHGMAVAHSLTPSRLPALFLTLDRNRQWWSTGSLLSCGQRVTFPGSQLVWEYYPGQGIQLQELGSWGQADWMYEGGQRFWPRLLRLVNELIPLGAQRGGALVWEYYFSFGGGRPPWTSAMSQGTAIQALTQAYRASHDARYLDLARRALVIFHRAPPTGVRLPTRTGAWYLLYSFAPDQLVLNGFLQSLIGLYDYAHVTGSADALQLFHQGDATARAALPSYDTGAWSLYQPGQEDSLDYHQLVTDFLGQLCHRTHASAYCTAAAHFRSYLRQPPALRLLTTRVRARQAGSVGFWVSKPARVGITVTSGGRTLFLTSADFSGGSHSFQIPGLPRPGSYTLILDSTDLAGNYAQRAFTLSATKK